MEANTRKKPLREGPTRNDLEISHRLFPFGLGKSREKASQTTTRPNKGTVRMLKTTRTKAAHHLVGLHRDIHARTPFIHGLPPATLTKPGKRQ